MGAEPTNAVAGRTTNTFTKHYPGAFNWTTEFNIQIPSPQLWTYSLAQVARRQDDSTTAPGVSFQTGTAVTVHHTKAYTGTGNVAVLFNDAKGRA